MNLSTRVLGASIVKQLTERTAQPILKIGKDAFTRGDLASIECFNFTAAANLSKLLSDLGVSSTKDLYDRVAPLSLAIPHLGAISLAVLGACFERKGLGGRAPLESWAEEHREKTEKDIVSFSTLKHRQADREDADRKGRKHARRNQAHRIRVSRFTKRQTRQAANG
jgi:hypothetical protein